MTSSTTCSMYKVHFSKIPFDMVGMYQSLSFKKLLMFYQTIIVGKVIRKYTFVLRHF